MTTNFHSKERQRKMLRRVIRRVERVSVVVLWWCLGVGVILGGYIAVTSLPLFAVASIVVHGELVHLTKESVGQLADIPVGANIFGVDVAAVQRRLSGEPWVAEAAVRRKLPNTIWIYVGERTPAALLNLDGLYLVDTGGNIFKQWEHTDGSDAANLPVLSGVNDVVVDDAGVGHSDQVFSLMRFRSQFERTNAGGELGVSEILMEKHGRISVVTATRPFMCLRFGEGFDNIKFNRLQEVMPYMAKDKVASVDLSIDRKVIVKVGM